MAFLIPLLVRVAVRIEWLHTSRYGRPNTCRCYRAVVADVQIVQTVGEVGKPLVAGSVRRRVPPLRINVLVPTLPWRCIFDLTDRFPLSIVYTSTSPPSDSISLLSSAPLVIASSSGRGLHYSAHPSVCISGVVGRTDSVDPRAGWIEFDAGRV